MAFNKDKAIIAQNSATVAAAIASAVIVANPSHATTTESACDLFDHIREHVFAESLRLADAETIVAGLEQGHANPQDNSPRRGAPPRSNAPRGNANGGSQPASGVPGDYVMPIGKNRGKTVATIHAETPEYLTWCLENMDPRKNADLLAAIRQHIEN